MAARGAERGGSPCVHVRGAVRLDHLARIGRRDVDVSPPRSPRCRSTAASPSRSPRRGLLDPAVEAAELIRQAHSHETLAILAGVHKNRQRARGGRGRAASARRSSARRAARRACRGAARRHVGAARGIAPGHAVDESAPCWYVACGAPVASAGAAMSKLRDGEVFAAHGTGPGCAAADAAWAAARRGRPLCEPLRSRPRRAWQPPAGTSVAFAYCDPRAPGRAGARIDAVSGRRRPRWRSRCATARRRGGRRRCTSRALARSSRSRVASTARTTRAPSAAMATTTPTRRRPTTTTRRSRRGSSANAPTSR